jgi:hypothetical protein
MKPKSLDIRADLRALPTSMFVSRWLLERIPHVFCDDFELYLQWKHDLGTSLGVDPRAIILVGSWSAPFRLETFHRDLREGRSAIFVVV